MELFETIRRDADRGGLSIRALSEKYEVHRRTVRQALAGATLPPRKKRTFPAPRLDPVKPLIEAMLREDLTAPCKQRHTARRVLARLVDEHDVREVLYSIVRDYVSRRRPEILAEAGRSVEQAFVPQTHLLGARRARWISPTCGSTCAGSARSCFCSRCGCRRRARRCTAPSPPRDRRRSWRATNTRFDVLGGIPFDKIRYDNLKSAVARVLFGRDRLQSQRWVTFRSHHRYDAFYCQPGVDGAHEKGGVEGEGGRFRRTHLVPVPKVDSLAELNARLEAADRRDDHSRIGHRLSTVGQDFAAEQPLLRPLPAERFETGLWLTPRVDRYAQITVRQCLYSVPARLVGRRVRALLRHR